MIRCLSITAAALVALATPAAAQAAALELGTSNTSNATTTLTGNTPGAELKVVNTNATDPSYGVLGLLTSTSPAVTSTALRGQNNAANAVGYGVWGSHAGSGAGVYGTAATGDGTGVYGRHLGSSGTGAGVRGQTDAAAGPGILGVNTGGGPGVKAIVDSGVPPLQVNSDTRVPLLNADKLDNLEATSFWKVGGNSGTTPGNYLGTSDDRALELRVNGARALRIEPTGSSFPNMIAGSSANDVTGTTTGGATIAGGGSLSAPNVVSDDFGTISGGRGNTASGGLDSIGGGFGNSSSGSYAAIGGGRFNVAKGYHATVPGGSNNSASGLDSFAAGYRAKAIHRGSFVWADDRLSSVFSNGDYTFTARATGGVRFISGINFTTGAPTAGVKLAAGGGSWSSLSDRAAKRAFTKVDRRALLRRLDRVPIQRWSYRAQKPRIRHLGPTAQGFHRAFGLGEDNRHITTVDADGIALAAIQGLYRQNRVLQKRLARLEREVARLRQG